MAVRRPFPRHPHSPKPPEVVVKDEPEPSYQLPRRSWGYVVMIRYAPGIWDFHPNRDAMFMTLPAAEVAALQVPSTLEVRIYQAKPGGVLQRVR